MPQSYIEPKGWKGTPGKWALSSISGQSIRLGNPVKGNRYINFWASEYAGNEAQLQADMAAVMNAKELIKALNPFAELAVQHITPEVMGSLYVQLRVPVSALLYAISVMVHANPDLKPVSKPYNPEGYL